MRRRHPLLLEASARVKQGYKPTAPAGLKQIRVGESSLPSERASSGDDDGLDGLTACMGDMRVVNQDMSPPRFLRAPSEYNTGGLSVMFDADEDGGFGSPEPAPSGYSDSGNSDSGYNNNRGAGSVLPVGSAARAHRGQLFDLLGRLPELSELFAVR